MIERIHLAIVREVQRRGSLTAAAQTLCLTQSALSHSIKKLEAQLGTALWQRDGRQLRLTQAGQALLAVANRVLPLLASTEQQLRQIARGERGMLRIGMECHPCYAWLLGVLQPFLAAWPHVDIDVRQQFKFGGLGALLNHDIDLLVTPDPVYKKELIFEPVFDYEQVLVVSRRHPLAGAAWIDPPQLAEETLLTYPVEADRLDIFKLFLTPAGIIPKQHKTVETTDILLQLVAANRGVTALPNWLVNEYASKFDIASIRLGPRGIAKQIFLGIRAVDRGVAYLAAFVQQARSSRPDKPGV
ncbi:HTH-type transcriptional regulator MetR [Tepidimonas alkaliphilus]|uniref:HTH-type transcriptional regulator MetR n=1 Tax=Tepidimonas alkaliphilus TaxID=2588942 RepID=A0A554WBU8_9BURK|nr:LysR family transcriptional regulator [Tepidimonas alkaliphilus]TSE21048.1 HTH-type transcriptional regulator MetR [Tepidimonas alkaliphilus]